MANLKFGNTNIGKISIIEPYEDTYTDGQTVATSDWTRPSGWLDMPSIGLDEHKCAFLFAIPSGEDNPQRFARLYAIGQYISYNNYTTDITFDWGDGSFSYLNQTNGPPWQVKEYDFNSLPVDTQLEIDGRPYRQALITISANSGIDHVNWRSYTNVAGGSRDYPLSNILEYNINTPSGRYIGGNIGGSSSTAYHLPILEKARVYAPKAHNFSTLFANTPKLNSLELYSGVMSDLTQVRYLFQSCGLKYIPDLDTSNVTLFNGMFSNFDGVKEFPSGKYDFSNVNATGLQNFFSHSEFEKINLDIPSHITDMSTMFYRCYNLKTIEGNWDTSNVTNFNYLSKDNVNLRRTPEINFASASSMQEAFYRNFKIKNRFFINASGCYNFRSAFNSCLSIEKITIADMFNYTGYASTYYDNCFSSCHSLKKVEVINPRIYTTRNEGVTGMFGYCRSLEHVPHLDFSGVKNFSSAFIGCSKLKSVGRINTPDGTNFYRMFYECYDLREVPDIDITCRGTGNVSIRQILESTAITEVPNYDFSRCYSMEGWKNNTRNIKSGKISLDLSNMVSSVNTYAYNPNMSLHPISEITDLTIGSGAHLRSAFSNMRYLKSIPFIDASNGYDYTGLFNHCSNLEVGALSGTDASIGYYRTGLGSGAVLDVFNNLASGVTSKTIDMRQTAGVYSLSSEQLSIPVAKGWTLLT